MCYSIWITQNISVGNKVKQSRICSPFSLNTFSGLLRFWPETYLILSINISQIKLNQLISQSELTLYDFGKLWIVDYLLSGKPWVIVGHYQIQVASFLIGKTNHLACIALIMRIDISNTIINRSEMTLNSIKHQI